MLIIAAVLAIAAVIIGLYLLEPIPVATGLVPVAVADKVIPKRDIYDYYLDKLEFCESRGDEFAINWYDKGSPSYGLLQFKVGTFVFYAKRYNLFPYAEINEYFNFIFDGNIQRLLAKKMLQEDFGNKKHWANCWTLMGLPEELPSK